MEEVAALRAPNSLVAGELLEQYPETRKYRLGPSILRPVRIRKTAFPRIAVLQRIVDAPAQRARESAHAAFASGVGLTTVALSKPNHTTRVWIDPTQVRRDRAGCLPGQSG